MMWGRILNFFNSRGEGTAWDLDYGKLIIIGLCIYIAIVVSGCHSIGSQWLLFGVRVAILIIGDVNDYTLFSMQKL